MEHASISDKTIGFDREQLVEMLMELYLAAMPNDTATGTDISIRYGYTEFQSMMDEVLDLVRSAP